MTTTTSSENIMPPPPSIPTDTMDTSHSIKPDTSISTEPPRKRMKVDAPQIPHYNSHNIYSRPPIPPSSMPIPSLPVIMPPVTPISAEDEQASSNHNDAALSLIGTCVAPLAESTEQWPLCAYCEKPGELSRCSSCRQAYYCNRDCQLNHWEVHCIVCQPGPPQPAELPKQGQPVQPPTHFTSFRPQLPPKAAVGGGYQMNGGYAGGHHNGYDRNGVGGGHPQHREPVKRSVSRRSSSYYGGDEESGNKEQYYCEECDRYFKNGQALGGHRSRVHSSRRNSAADPGAPHPGPGPIPHGPPEHTTARRRRRAKPRGRHEPSGNGQYVCPHCSREFATGNALGGHISGAHTKKSKRLAREREAYGGPPMHHQPRFARPRHPNL